MPETNDYVILLHGLGRTALSMRKLASTLRHEGYIVHNIDYPSRSASINQIVQQVLIPRITSACPDTTKTIHFVGHSMGGILIRALLADTQFRADFPHIGNVAQLAPPNQGAIAADKWSLNRLLRFFLGPAIDEMTSATTSAVRALPQPDFTLGIIAGKFDKKVLVDQSRLHGAADFLVVKSGHTFIMRRKEVIQAIVKFLKEKRFTK